MEGGENMPVDKEHGCVYECNKGIKCECSDCSICKYNPKKEVNPKHYYASGMALVEGRWQSCGWTIEANSFAEAAQIAEADEKYRIHSLSDNVMY